MRRKSNTQVILECRQSIDITISKKVKPKDNTWAFIIEVFRLKEVEINLVLVEEYLNRVNEYRKD